MKSLFIVPIFIILATTALGAQSSIPASKHGGAFLTRAKTPESPEHVYQPVRASKHTGQRLNNCTFGGLPMFLPDNYAGSFNLSVQGATNSLLGINGQGLCGVRLNLDHEYIGDLNVTLTSPGGQMITLMGPAGLFGATDNSIWDVIFRPCNTPVTPDPGYSAEWNNNQNWGMGGSFSGEYYPQMGCLNSLTGPVNGIWALNVTDTQAQDVGTLYNFELIFCDASGLGCISCGNISTTLPDVVVCQQSLPFTWNQPPYTVVNTPGVTVLESTPFVATSGCDSVVRQHLEVLNPVAHITSTGTILTCAQPAIYLYSAASPGTLKTWIDVGNNSTQVGESYAVTRSGMYILNVSRTTGGVECTQSDTIIIGFSPNILPVTITGGTIGCGQNTTTISATASGFGLFYTWSGPEGFTATIPAPVVSLPGEYTVTVTSIQGCTGTASVTLSRDTTPPSFDSIAVVHPLTGQNNGHIHLIISGTPSYSYFWTYNGEFIADTRDISGLSAGIYQCMITGGNNCSNILTVELIETTATTKNPDFTQWVLSPNPGDGHFVLSQTGQGGVHAAIYLYNIAGKLVWQQAEQWIGEATLLDFSNLSIGQYWLRLTGAQGTVILKPIINK